jgi:hypothetical protein
MNKLVIWRISKNCVAPDLLFDVSSSQCRLIAWQSMTEAVQHVQQINEDALPTVLILDNQNLLAMCHPSFWGRSCSAAKMSKILN